MKKMTKYTSKIDLILLLPLIFIFGGGIAFAIYLQVWIPLIIMLITSFFVAHVFSTTYYIVDSSILTIRSSYLINMRIDIGNIKEIVETRDAISSPALSFDRLYIKYKEKSDIIVSPKDKEGFIKELLLLNPKIIINRK
jgi:hypothetical protein